MQQPNFDLILVDHISSYKRAYKSFSTFHLNRKSDELNYYLSKWDYIKNKYKPQDKTFCSVDVLWDVIVSGAGGSYTYKIKYGVNIGSNPN